MICLLAYVQNIFFHSFYTFEVVTHFIAAESFLNEYLQERKTIEKKKDFILTETHWNSF